MLPSAAALLVATASVASSAQPTALPSPPVTDMTFIGGYTVEGHSIAASLRADGNVSSQASAFSVAQVRRWPALRCAAGPAAGPLTSVRAIRCRC